MANKESASDIFNHIVGESINAQKNHDIYVSRHPDYNAEVENIVSKILNTANISEIWRPQLEGVVIEVVDSYLDDEARKILNTKVKHSQRVVWIAVNGAKFQFSWDDEKPTRQDVDYQDFPDGFQLHDCIRITEKGAFITKVERITPQEVLSKLPHN